MAHQMSFFLSIPVNDRLRNRLEPMRTMQGLSHYSWTDPYEMHVTMKLLCRSNTMPTAMLAAVCERMAGFTFPRTSLFPGRVGHFPQARVIFLSLRGANVLGDLHQRLNALLDDVPDVVPHPHSTFIPHITLFRYREDEPHPSVDLRNRLNDYLYSAPVLAVRRINLTCTHDLPDGKTYDPSFKPYAWYEEQAHAKRLRQGKRFGDL